MKELNNIINKKITNFINRFTFAYIRTWQLLSWIYITSFKSKNCMIKKLIIYILSCYDSIHSLPVVTSF